MPNTIAENLQRLIDAKTAIGSAITAKGGTVGANDGLEEFASDIATIPSGGGGGSQPRKDVNFYDYDGTIVNSYTAAEFAELSAMPSNPSHDGLTAQGWNWSLADAKSYVASYGKLDIGQMYITSDGKTRLYITLTEGRTSPVLKLFLNANSELDIDWGDGSTHSTLTSTSKSYKSEMHSYSATGDYVISIAVITGSFVLMSSSDRISTILSNNNGIFLSPDYGYAQSIWKIEIGSNVSLYSKTFVQCGIKYVTIPNTISNISDVFYNCENLMVVIIPNTITVIGSSAFQNGVQLTIVSLPNSITGIYSYAFNECKKLRSLIIPNSVTTIEASAFSSCRNLAYLTIPKSVSSIGTNVFNSCYFLATIAIDKAAESISGSPWGAVTSSPTYTQIIWTGE